MGTIVLPAEALEAEGGDLATGQLHPTRDACRPTKDTARHAGMVAGARGR